jgi:hypothetical protein
MRIILRIIFAVVALSPLIILQGRPDLAPAWLEQDVAGVPAVILLAAAWFALFVMACWVPVRGSDGR